ncbi:asparagine synthase (glutamine-hydrolyzing) [Synechococcus sp. HJ21-Hayes]|uniref:asparagine synthase (glutamine-hydrolyzing) n=1 Tax=unclassified Synechococcus TaxID=2626047 RepID=UPI0020CBBC83|nr:MULTISPECIES: asparagine synthase (glutamine-hydrolyzing) [unclassified Synechococcus]MCP9830098.1 asparagine synthase (glutamine-hydrolyzing) [Synechococcus sp. JJ3a-Johnson]MCP9852094.1 asparagine synthase (glutamine-hydrolyzing) [Synechococcus sp. HJ21-Hayes]
MCGIAGFIAAAPLTDADAMRTQAHAMAHSILHRGPDDGDIWIDAGSGVALAHRRLSVLDLSPAGHQPMQSACARYLLVYNGEIYNWAELRGELDAAGHAPVWRGYSDTEVLLASIVAWGLEVTLRRARGMFALALWDRAEKTLTLARDRIGEKPLYYGRVGDGFAFGSELKALRALPAARFETDPGALALMLRYGYVPAPYSIYRGIFKLPPGTLLRVGADGRFGDPEPWWCFAAVAQEGAANHHALSDGAALDELEAVLGSAIDEQIVADVPLGALLSGGLDSSIVVALMQARSTRSVRTFTIGFTENDYNEAAHAKAVARHLGTEHTELHVDPEQALEIIPRLPDIYDEPFADSSQIPTALVCSLTKQHVTVCLSGDAGDELFGGYNRYFWATSLWRRIGPIPPWLRRAASGALTAMPAATWNGPFDVIGPWLPTQLRVSNPGDKLHKLAEVIAAPSPEGLYRELVSQWRGPLPLGGIAELPTLVADPGRWPALPSFAERMMAVDSLTYLPDDILVKVDRAAMAASLETRVPFLDPRVIDFAWHLPLRQKVRNGQGKWLLRQLLYRYVPRELVERPKQGFGVPIEHWLRGPLRDWAEDLLSPAALAADGLLNPAPIRAMWQRHLSGRNVQYALWNVLMYQAWRRRWA